MKWFKLMAVMLMVYAGIGCRSAEAEGNGDNVTDQPASSTSDGRSWKEIAAEVAGQVFLGTEKGEVFYAFDTLARPGEKVQLIARLQTVKFLRGIQQAELGYYLDDDLVGTAVTDEEGFATLEWKAKKPGDYDFRVKIIEPGMDQSESSKEITAAPLLVAVRHKKTEFVVIDLDHTVVDSSFFKVLMGGGTPMADSVEVTNRIAKKYGIIYLTHRPDLMTYRSKTWLRDHGYPLGPLLVSELKQALGSSGKYKTAKLDEIRKEFGGVKIGIGDKLSDAQAYVDNGLTAYLIPNYKHKAKAMEQMSQEIRSLHGNGRLQVISGWRAVEKGIFEGKTYPAKTYADWLDGEAKRLHAIEQDDDDDHKKKDD